MAPQPWPHSALKAGSAMLATALAVWALTACGTGTGTGTGTESTPAASTSETSPGSPGMSEDTSATTASTPAPDPPWGENITVIADDTTYDLAPWTGCADGGCWDGAQPADPPDVGSPASLTIAHPNTGWTFTATFTSPGECGDRVAQTTATNNGDGTWTLDPAGGAGRWTVDLFGYGDGSDGVVTVVWTTPTSGPAPAATSTLAFLADHDGALDSYGVELAIAGLQETPEQVEAVATATGPNGVSVTRTLTRAAVDRCRTSLGSLWVTSPDTPGIDPLGTDPSGPFSYRVDLTLDGVSYVGTATWPADADAQGVITTLTWDPPLPAWDGTYPQ